MPASHTLCHIRRLIHIGLLDGVDPLYLRPTGKGEGVGTVAQSLEIRTNNGSASSKLTTILVKASWWLVKSCGPCSSWLLCKDTTRLYQASLYNTNSIGGQDKLIHTLPPVKPDPS